MHCAALEIGVTSCIILVAKRVRSSILRSHGVMKHKKIEYLFRYIISGRRACSFYGELYAILANERT